MNATQAIETIKATLGIDNVFTAATEDVRAALPASCIHKDGVLSQHVREGDEIILRDAERVALTRTCTVEKIRTIGQFAHDRIYVLEVSSVFGRAIAAVKRGVWVECWGA